MSKLLELYADLEKAARGFRDAGDRNHYKGMGTTTGSDHMSVHEMRVAYAELLATLDALTAHRAAHPGGETCATCRKCVDHECLRAQEDNAPMKAFPRETGQGTRDCSPGGWLEVEATHSCAAWEERENE